MTTRDADEREFLKREHSEESTVTYRNYIDWDMRAQIHWLRNDK